MNENLSCFNKKMVTDVEFGMVCMPANNNKLPFWKSVMISIPVVFLVLGVQAYLAYSVYGFDPTGSFNMWAAGGSIFVILGSSFMS